MRIDHAACTNWLLSPELGEVVEDVSDLTFGPDRRVYPAVDQFVVGTRAP